MAREGGGVGGVIHRNMTAESEVAMVRSVKESPRYSLQYIKVAPEAPVGEALAMMTAANLDSIPPIVADDGPSLAL